MLSTDYRNNEHLTGFYHFLTEVDEIQELSGKLCRLNMKEISRHNPMNHYIYAPIYDGALVVLQLKEVYGLPIGLIHFLEKGEIAIVNFRFHGELYKDDTHIYGELRIRDGLNYLEIYAIRMGPDEKLTPLLEAFDQILYTKFVEDLDLEPIRLVFKRFYNNLNELDSSRAIYLNNNLNGQHYITRGTA